MRVVANTVVFPMNLPGGVTERVLDTHNQYSDSPNLQGSRGRSVTHNNINITRGLQLITRNFELLAIHKN